MSDQQNPDLQMVEQGGGESPSTLVALSGAGTPEDHFMHDEMTTEMKLTLGKVDANVQALLSTVNSLATQLAAIQTQVANIDSGLTGLGGLIRLPNGVSLGNAVQTIMQKVQ
jgi:hypothetical protein